MPLPRIITVDPTWTLARTIRSAVDLLDRPVVQIDVPDGTEALAEAKQGCTLLIANFEVDANMRGFELALKVKQLATNAAIIILGEDEDPEEFDHETAVDSPYAYLRRPMDMQKFLRVLQAGLDGTSLVEAQFPPAMAAPALNTDMGPVPPLDPNAAQGIIDSLQVDVGAMAIMLATRTGDVLLERGAVGLMNREKLTTALLPAVLTNIEAKELLGGQLTSIQFYDGEQFDVFVLTVGLHHFLCAIFDGAQGSRQFGAINRFGRKAVEELIGKIGASAFFIQKVQVQPEDSRTARSKAKKQRERETEEVETVSLAKAEIIPSPIPHAEPDTLKLEPVAELDLDKLFGASTNLDAADDLFSLDSLEELASQNFKGSKGKLGWDQAREIGIIPE